jgi:hypothetical protein
MSEISDAPIRLLIESGRRKVFASALDWPGWARSGRSEEAAIEELLAYAERYAVVASVAGQTFDAVAITAAVDIVERVPGNATTDFGAPDGIAAGDCDPWRDDVEGDRHASLVAAAWHALDDAAARATAELRKGPRGGGRDRDEVVAHVISAEASYARKIGVRHKAPDPTDQAAVAALRADILDALREPRSDLPPRPWPLRYAVRRIAWHALDHAWEIEDKSLG